MTAAVVWIALVGMEGDDTARALAGPAGLAALFVGAFALAVWWTNRNTRGPR